MEAPAKSHRSAMGRNTSLQWVEAAELMELAMLLGLEAQAVLEAPVGLGPAEPLVEHHWRILQLAVLVLEAHQLALLKAAAGQAAQVQGRLEQAGLMGQLELSGNVHHPLQRHHPAASPWADGLAVQPGGRTCQLVPLQAEHDGGRQ